MRSYVQRAISTFCQCWTCADKIFSSSPILPGLRSVPSVIFQLWNRFDRQQAPCELYCFEFDTVLVINEHNTISAITRTMAATASHKGRTNCSTSQFFRPLQPRWSIEVTNRNGCQTVGLHFEHTACLTQVQGLPILQNRSAGNVCMMVKQEITSNGTWLWNWANTNLKRNSSFLGKTCQLWKFTRLILTF